MLDSVAKYVMTLGHLISFLESLFLPNRRHEDTYIVMSWYERSLVFHTVSAYRNEILTKGSIRKHSLNEVM